jgi:hypothetical protein
MFKPLRFHNNGFYWVKTSKFKKTNIHLDFKLRLIKNMSDNKVILGSENGVLFFRTVLP